jgi:glycosyltransferase involved in cell wall biosynthesis
VKLAIITAIYNESVLLPQLLRHYAPQVDAVFLVDNESDDGSLEVARAFRNVQVSFYSTSGKFYYRLKHLALEAKRRECIGEFDYVLMVDADEFVVPKNGGGLKGALEGLGTPEAFYTHGFHMWRVSSEAAYDPRKPLTEQRTHGIESLPGDLYASYSKPIIIRPSSSLSFSPGMHGFEGSDNPSLESLRKSAFYLLHYVGIEESIYVERSMVRTRRLSEENIKKKYSLQYYGGTEELYRQRFRQNALKASPVSFFAKSSSSPQGS